MDKNSNINKKESNSIINVEEKLKILESENNSLKSQLNISLEKEKLYNSTIEKIKKMQSENEKSYFDALKESKIREEEIQQKFLEFQKILENQYNENEKRLTDEITQLTIELSKRDNIINSLQNNLNSLNDKISQDELNYHFKEKEFENIIKIKERKLDELNIAVKQITKEATEEIKRLSEQLEDFQIKTKNNTNNFNDDNKGNYINNNINRNRNNNINNNSNIIELKNEIYMLQNKNNILSKELEKKNREINFWKSQRNNINNRDDTLKELRIKQLERTFINYGNKVKQIDEKYRKNTLQNQKEKISLLKQIDYLKNVINELQMNNYNLNENDMNNIDDNYNIINTNPNMENDINLYNNNDINNHKNNDINAFNSNDINYNINNNDINQLNNNNYNNEAENMKHYNNEDINNINYMNEIKNLPEFNELEKENEADINNMNQDYNDMDNNYENEMGEENDIKELQISNDDINNENENKFFNEEENNQMAELPINNMNMPLINRMQNNIPSGEAMRNEYINNELQNMPKSDYEEQI